MLDLSSLKSAVVSMEKTISVVHDKAFMNNLNEDQRNAIRSGVIQNFEFTYELSWKFVQRWIRLNKTPEDADTRTRKDLFRMAAHYRLISDPIPWFEYGEARNITSHTYDEVKAKSVYDVAVRFIDDAKYLLKQLEISND